MKLIVDRFEEEYVVCEKENKEYVNIHINDLPSEVKIGDIIYIENDNILLDKKATTDRERYIEELTKDIWQ